MKRIILCFDGTCNNPSNSVRPTKLLGGLGDKGITNILKLHLLFGGNLKANGFDESTPAPNSPQMSFYYSGVGSYGNWWHKLINKTLSPLDEDVGDIIKRAAGDLHEHYEQGDELYVFGFSRGAAIARRFSALLPTIFRVLEKGFEPEVKFLGVFDTVAAMNKPNLLNPQHKPASDVLFEDCNVCSIVKEAVHLVALDEKRIVFQPTLMNKAEHITELWMPGAHSDVGGGYYHRGLSDYSLLFMLNWLRGKGFGLDILQPEAIDYANLLNHDPASDGAKVKTGIVRSRTTKFKKVKARAIKQRIDISLDDVAFRADVLGVNHQQEISGVVKKHLLADRDLRVNIHDRFSTAEPLLSRGVISRINGGIGYQPPSLNEDKRINPYTRRPITYKILDS